MSGNLIPLFATLTHGIYVVGVAADEQSNAFTAAWVMQTSFRPPILALSINPLHSSYALLKEGGFFTVNVLKKGQKVLATHFAKRIIDEEKLTSVEWYEAKYGAPIIDSAMAWFECELVGEIQSGDHMLVLGRVIAGELLDENATPMDYHEMEGTDATMALLPDHF
jgi:flavin reductase (DIM6/NTAB) family NADH-FMN oxidoreductase RutF